MVEISNVTPAAIPPVYNMANVAGSTNQQAADSSVNATESAAKVSVSLTSKVLGDSAQSKQVLTAEELQNLVDEGNALLSHSINNNNLQFQIDEATDQVVVKVVDTNTGEVVRQFPSTQMLDFMRAMRELEGNAGKLLKAAA